MPEAREDVKVLLHGASVPRPTTGDNEPPLVGSIGSGMLASRRVRREAAQEVSARLKGAEGMS